MKKIILLAAVTLAMTACDNNDDNVVPASGAAKITATIGESVTSRAVDTSWNEGDKIGISATVAGVEKYVNMEYTTSGDGNFTGNPIYFYKPMSLTAYYPFTGVEGTAPGVIEANTDAENQKSDTQPLIDFLYADETGIDVSGNAPEVKFTFSHRMSKITLIFVNGNVDENGDAIDKGADVSKITSYQIEGLILDGTFDTQSGVCAAKDVDPATLSMTATNVVSGKAVSPLIVFPQATADKTVKLKIHDEENQDYVCTLNFGDNGLVAGHNYQFTIKVSKTGLTVNSDITEWKTEELGSEAGSDDTEDPETPEEPNEDESEE